MLEVTDDSENYLRVWGFCVYVAYAVCVYVCVFVGLWRVSEIIGVDFWYITFLKRKINDKIH